jgi:hypothetical protein
MFEGVAAVGAAVAVAARPRRTERAAADVVAAVASKRPTRMRAVAGEAARQHLAPWPRAMPRLWPQLCVLALALVLLDERL